MERRGRSTDDDRKTVSVARETRGLRNVPHGGRKRYTHEPA
jgi:hypothetical protein